MGRRKIERAYTTTSNETSNVLKGEIMTTSDRLLRIGEFLMEKVILRFVPEILIFVVGLSAGYAWGWKAFG